MCRNAAIILVAACLICPTLAVGAVGSRIEYRDLGAGELDIKLKQLDGERLGIQLKTDFQEVVGIIVRDHDGSKELLRVFTEQAGSALSDVLAEFVQEEPVATMTIDVPVLSGASSVIEHNLTGSRKLEVLLIQSDGDVFPFGINSPSLGQIQQTFEFTGAGPCYNVSIHCENGCWKTVRCCTLPPAPCATCTATGCEVHCPPCEPF